MSTSGIHSMRMQAFFTRRNPDHWMLNQLEEIIESFGSVAIGLRLKRWKSRIA